MHFQLTCKVNEQLESEQEIWKRLQVRMDECKAADGDFKTLFKQFDIGCYFTNPSKPALEGYVLQHAKEQIDVFRRHVGLQVCVYKIGITANPLVRFHSYKQSNYTLMRVIHISPDLGLIKMLEAALVDIHIGLTGCRNTRLGGDGPLNSAKSKPPYCCYVVAAPADQKKRIH